MDIEKHLHYEFYISEFVGCKVTKLYDRHEFKGIYFSPDNHLFYIFINIFYLRGEFNLLSRQFRIQHECMHFQKEKRVKFVEGIRNIERLNMKHVKQVTIDKTYLTMSPFETLSLEVEKGDQKGEEQFISRPIKDKLVHICPNQLLEFDGIAFCFELSVSLDRRNPDCFFN